MTAPRPRAPWHAIMVPAVSTGYYSLLQYCPDLSRLEAANVGVLLFAPAHHFLEASTASDNRRIRKFFGKEHDWERINSYKRAIEERVALEHARIRSPDDLDRFIGQRANHFQFTPPRSIKVRRPEDELLQLFRELVGGEPRTGAPVSFKSYLNRRFSEAGVFSLLRTDIPVKVPHFERPIEFPFGYQNGRFHLIQPARFLAADAEKVFSSACRYAVEGKSLFDTTDPALGPLQLVVLGRFPAAAAETRVRVERLLHDYHVELYAESDLDRLIQDIRRRGKPVAEPRGLPISS